MTNLLDEIFNDMESTEDTLLNIKDEQLPKFKQNFSIEELEEAIERFELAVEKMKELEQIKKELGGLDLSNPDAAKRIKEDSEEALRLVKEAEDELADVHRSGLRELSLSVNASHKRLGEERQSLGRFNAILSEKFENIENHRDAEGL